MLTCRPFAVNRVRAIGAIAVADGYLNSFDRKFLNMLRNWDAVGNFQIYPSFNALVVRDDSVLGRPTKPRMSLLESFPTDWRTLLTAGSAPSPRRLSMQPDRN